MEDGGVTNGQIGIESVKDTSGEDILKRHVLELHLKQETVGHRHPIKW